AGDGNSVYFVTGNSDPKGNSRKNPGNLTMSVVELSPNLQTLKSSFTPSDYPVLESVDYDVGAGGILLLPPQQGSIPALAVAAGKEGKLYLMNRASLGGYSTTTNKVLGTYPVGFCNCGESYFTGKDGIPRIVSSGGVTLQTWQLHTSPTPHLVADTWSH